MVTSVNFELLAEPPIPEWVVRVTVKGSGFEIRAVPVGARVGEIPVEGIMLAADESGFTGYLSAEPPDGSPLLVGFLEGPLTDTGLVYHAPNV